MTLEATGCTDTGAVRGNNEDAFQCCREWGVFVVCDGMGGAAAGEIASQMAVACVMESLCGKDSKSFSNENAAQSVMLQAISAANRKIYERAQKEPILQGMGTTIVLAMLVQGMAHVAHVGDSRCYRWRGGQLEQLTQDHSLVGEQVRLGKLSPAEAEVSPYRNVITRALGTERTVQADYQQIQMKEGDLLLLCSDGLTRELHGDAIAGVVVRAAEGEDLDAVCRMLIDRANQAGGRDNITCVLVRV